MACSPSLSIVIPTYNRADDLAKTLNSIRKQTLDDFEVLVIDGGPSTDGTSSLAFDLARQDSRFRYHRLSKRGVTLARSYGNRLATGKIIIQMDSDVSLVDPNTLRITNEIFRSHAVDVLGILELHDRHLVDEHLVTSAHPELLEEFPAIDGIGTVSRNYDISSGFQRLKGAPIGLYEIRSFRSCFMAFRREVLRRAGHWDVNYTRVGSAVGLREETDFLLRAERAGCDVRYTNVTAIWHRAGRRDGSLVQRGRGIRYHFHLQAAHAYMVTRDLLERRASWRMPGWFLHQLVIGGPRNPSVASLLIRNGEVSSAAASFAGVIYGTAFGVLHQRDLEPLEQWTVRPPRK